MKKESKFIKILKKIGFIPDPNRKSWSSRSIKTDTKITFNECAGLNDNYLFDFKNFSSSYNNNFTSVPTQGTISFGTSGNVDSAAGGGILPGGDAINVISNQEPSKPIKIKVKPIDVLNELETVPTPFTMALLDEKLSILRDKEELINQQYAKREMHFLIERLENRKKYNEHRAFFDKFQNTTDEKINKLLKDYDLVMRAADIFIPEFPDEAVNTMKEYTKHTEMVCAKKPIFYVIAEVEDFKQADKKRDPILLVQSPFGFYWQILGAWDKEMILLSSL